jgi:hydrogenase expression/formation protein HypC
MCLALPMRITAIDGQLATIVAEGVQQRASIVLVPDAAIGDYVLVHAGYAISVIDEADAGETYALLAELAAAAAWEDSRDRRGETGGILDTDGSQEDP